MVDKNAVSGRIDSPVRLDIEEAADIIGLDFILNVVLDSHKNVVAAFAGDFRKAHRAGVSIVDEMYKVPAQEVDSVVVSCGGYPKDINLYQANKALENAAQIVRDGGSLILVAECADGIGNTVYEKWNQECLTPADAIKRFKHSFEFGGHKTAKTAAVAQRLKLYIYSSLPFKKAQEAYFTPVSSVDEAVRFVIRENPSAQIYVMPYGGQTLPSVK